MSAPTDLQDFQRRVARAVMAPLTSRWTMARRGPGGVAMADEAAALVKPNRWLSSYERLEIYNRQYWFRVLDSLEEDYPGLLAVLGRRRFGALARAYLAECPSRSFTLRNLGSRLPSWLGEHPEYLEPRRQLALDMARLEWAHMESFDEAAWPVLGPEDLAGLAEDTRLLPQPHLRVLDLAYPVDDLLLEVRAQEERADLGGNGALAARRRRLARRVAERAPENLHLAVHRYQDTVHYKRLEPESGRLLRAVLAGEPLGSAIEAGFRGSAMPEAERPGFLRDSFHLWAALGWFARPGCAHSGDVP
jgi:hypothetical protein